MPTPAQSFLVRCSTAKAPTNLCAKLIFEGLLLPVHRVRFWGYARFARHVRLPRHFEVWSVVLRDRCKTSGRSGTLLKHWQGRVDMRGGFRGHFSWQAQYLVNLDDVGQGSRASSCEAVVICDLMRDDHFAWLRCPSDAWGSFSWQAQYFVDRGGKEAIKTLVKHRSYILTVHVLAQPFCHFVPAESLFLWRCAHSIS